jgi:serine/threonine protein kinase
LTEISHCLLRQDIFVFGVREGRGMNRQLTEESVFKVAFSLESEELRGEYLRQVSLNHPDLCQRVIALLNANEKQPGFLESPAAPVETAKALPLIVECAGITIGPYKLMEQIGEGGMGVVFVAQQERPIRRKVALKIIKPGMDSKAVIARFEAERQALAMMDHPNIAKVLDAGTTESGKPYFAMELVKGVPVTEYCDKNRLTIPERLDLFSSVCQAIQHAHQKGIIHRDIKPSNILVTLHDGRPVPVVIDFGVAKALNTRLTDKTVYTEHLQVVGTLLYMSPEQAEFSGLDVDTRADIYSLGVLLYELLTGTTPFQKDELEQAGFDEQRRIIREKEPPRCSIRISSLGETATVVADHRKTDPRKLNQLVRGDMDWIVMKALEKDRTRRYSTASNLAADVERFLVDEPIEARPPSRSYLFFKFARRNRVSLTVSAIIATILIASLVLEIGRNRELAANRKSLAAANQELEATLALLQTELLDRAFSDALAGDVVACEYSLRRAKQAKAPDEQLDLIRGLSWAFSGRLTDGIEFFENAKKDRPDDVAIWAVLSWAYFNLGHIQSGTEATDHLIDLVSNSEVPRSDYETLLVSLARDLSTWTPDDIIPQLDEIISRHPRWGSAYAIRAELRVNAAKRSRSIDLLRLARDDADKAIGYSPNNAFVLASAMHAYLTTIELARYEPDLLSSEEFAQLQADAAHVERELVRHPHSYIGAAIRLVYLRIMGRHQEMDAEYERMAEKGFGGGNHQVLVARMLERTDGGPSLRAYSAEHPDSFAACTAAALLDLMEGKTASAEQALETLHKRFTNLNQRWLMLDIAFAAKEPDVARRFAAKFYRQAEKGESANIGNSDLLMTEYYAGLLDDESLLEKCGPFLIENSVGHYAIGMRKLSVANTQEDLQEAKEHLLVAARCPVPGWWHIEFAKTYLKMIDDGRLPIGEKAWETSGRTDDTRKKTSGILCGNHTVIEPQTRNGCERRR